MAKYSYLANGSKSKAENGSGVGLVYRGSLIYKKAANGTLTFDGAGIPEGRLVSGGVRYYVTDHLGSVKAVVNGMNGNLYEVNDYDVYGKRTANSSASSYLSTAPSGEVFRDRYTGKEDQGPDFSTAYTDFGARQFSPNLRRWLVSDPLSEKYYGVSPYAYCAGNPVNLVDPEGSNPIYSVSGVFLGTDDKGLIGDYIVMNEESFLQGMTHEDALSCSFIGPLSDITINAINEHYNMLSSRPDYDGVVTIAEGVAWAKSHVGALDNPTPYNTLFIDASKIDFGNLYSNDPVLKEGSFESVNLYKYVDLLSLQSIYSTYALGNTSIKLIDAKTGSVKLSFDKYDWDYHHEFKNGRPVGLRDKLIFLERKRVEVNDTHGFPIQVYGTGHLRLSFQYPLY